MKAHRTLSKCLGLAAWVAIFGGPGIRTQTSLQLYASVDGG